MGVAPVGLTSGDLRRLWEIWGDFGQLLMDIRRSCTLTIGGKERMAQCMCCCSDLLCARDPRSPRPKSLPSVSKSRYPTRWNCLVRRSDRTSRSIETLVQDGAGPAPREPLALPPVLTGRSTRLQAVPRDTRRELMSRQFLWALSAAGLLVLAGCN